MELGGIVTVVGSSKCVGKANVAELGAGRVKEERWEVFVRGMFVFCRMRACWGSRRVVVVEDETIVFGVRGEDEMD